VEVGEEGLRPMELLLTALGGCSGVDVYTILRKKRQPLKSLEIKVRGFRRDVHPRIYEKIELEFLVNEEVDARCEAFCRKVLQRLCHA